MKIVFSFNSKILFLLIFPIFIQIESPVQELYIKKDYLLFNMFKIFLSYVMFIPFVLIFKYRTKKNQRRNSEITRASNLDEKSEKTGDHIKKEITKNKRETIRNNILLLLALSLIDLVAYYINYYENDNSEQIKFFLNSIGILFEIINFGLISYLLLDKKYYRHHFLSFGIIFISLFISFIFYIIKEDLKFYIVVIIIMYYYTYTLLYSSYNVLGKKYLDEYFQSPYEMLFKIGLINITLLLFYDIIAFFCNDKYSGVIIGFRDNIVKYYDFLFFFLELIIKCLYTSGIWLTIYYFTPLHFIISDFISEIIKFYIHCIKNSHKISDDIIIIFTITYFINFCGSLVFNEIVILKFCKLEYYTNKYIQKREKIDSTLMEISDNDDESIYL